MRIGRKYWFGAAVCITLVIAYVAVKLPGAFAGFQHDADILRLQHLKYYGTLIEEYREKTGKYPLQGKSELPIYVHVANDQQVESTKKGPAPYEHEIVPFANFIKEVEAGIGRPIDEYYDPQIGPLHRPNFYIYLVHKDYYFFAVHLDQNFPFAKRVGDHYYKAEISNAANDQNQAQLPLQLFEDAKFIAASQEKLFKPKFFGQREAYYLHNTKK